jgi:hypothetical protein
MQVIIYIDLLYITTSITQATMNISTQTAFLKYLDEEELELICVFATKTTIILPVIVKPLLLRQQIPPRFP